MNVERENGQEQLPEPQFNVGDRVVSSGSSKVGTIKGLRFFKGEGFDCWMYEVETKPDPGENMFTLNTEMPEFELTLADQEKK